MKNPFVKILIADDDPDDLELVESAITETLPTAKLILFTSGQSALDYLNTCVDTELPSLIVLDYNMPVMTGTAVLGRLDSIKRYSAIPKVILSTSDSSLFVEESLSKGAQEYLVKPVSVSELNTLAKRLLGFCGVV